MGSRTSFNGGLRGPDHMSATADVVEEEMIQYAYDIKAGSAEVGIYLKANFLALQGAIL